MGRIPAYKQALEAALGAGASERLAMETLTLLPQFNQTARTLSDRFWGSSEPSKSRPSFGVRASRDSEDMAVTLSTRLSVAREAPAS